MLSGLVDQVARRVDPDELKEGEDKRKWKHAYQIPDIESPVFMHSSSVLRKELPQWVVYQEIYETNKAYMRGNFFCLWLYHIIFFVYFSLIKNIFCLLKASLLLSQSGCHYLLLLCVIYQIQ